MDFLCVDQETIADLQKRLNKESAKLHAAQHEMNTANNRVRDLQNEKQVLDRQIQRLRSELKQVLQLRLSGDLTVYKTLWLAKAPAWWVQVQPSNILLTCASTQPGQMHSLLSSCSSCWNASKVKHHTLTPCWNIDSHILLFCNRSVSELSLRFYCAGVNLKKQYWGWASGGEETVCGCWGWTRSESGWLESQIINCRIGKLTCWGDSKINWEKSARS